MMKRDDEGLMRDTPQNWEALARRSPARWDRFTRSDGLERWTAAHDDALERDIADTTRRIQALDQDLRPVARAALGDEPSHVWRALLGALVISAWDSARRMSGHRDACVGRVLEHRRASFSSLAAALEFAVYRQPLLGITSRAPVVLRDRSRDVAARMSARAAGTDMRQPRTTFVGKGEPRGIAAVDLRADVLQAIRRSRIRALDFWLVVASDVGELLPRARRSKHGIESTFARRTPAQLATRLRDLGAPLEVADLRLRIHAAREHLRDELEARELVALGPRLSIIHGPELPTLSIERSAP